MYNKEGKPQKDVDETDDLHGGNATTYWGAVRPHYLLRPACFSDQFPLGIILPFEFGTKKFRGFTGLQGLASHGEPLRVPFGCIAERKSRGRITSRYWTVSSFLVALPEPIRLKF